ncbi:MotA/TolQ/ExbB proton channel family protein [Methylomonas sp. SURF-2]|uniref:MotA/TolQ/ExbB proton channel family protein n=1 Tax=Methylomonas subterranea TaxID=2952225 RepID=A0ABT1TJ75_9GAMM|nr:MotA/TolQ/ExbB proton channel family protein [Methylomonas sp. SURF-2]MCQ8105369.1 MotA/TolQ/ExbB proton channel family protein [Methylomonas sp. SURF-2]
MDFATLLGPIVALCAIAVALLLDQSNPFALLNGPSLILVLGGTLGATMMAYPLKSFLLLPRFVWQCFKFELPDPRDHIDFFVKLANITRRGGLLALENDVSAVEDVFLRNALTLVVDGVNPEQVLRVMEIDNEMTTQRHYLGISMLSTMAGVAPPMGLIGTVVGLIDAMGNLSDPAGLGPSIALAFLTTLYGTLLSNLIFSPMANKLKQKNKEEMFLRELCMEGVLAVQECENPRIVRQKLESFLRPKSRGMMFDADLS